MPRWPRGHCCQQLVEKLFDEASEHMRDFMVIAHRPTTVKRSAPAHAGRPGSMSKVLHTLKLAYRCHLKKTLEDQWDDEHARSVRELADIIKGKLTNHLAADAAQLGEGELESLLAALQQEFRWMTCAEVFEECARKARAHKDKAFVRAEEAQTRLLQRRQDAEAETADAKRRKTCPLAASC